MDVHAGVHIFQPGAVCEKRLRAAAATESTGVSVCVNGAKSMESWGNRSDRRISVCVLCGSEAQSGCEDSAVAGAPVAVCAAGPLSRVFMYAAQHSYLQILLTPLSSCFKSLLQLFSPATLPAWLSCSRSPCFSPTVWVCLCVLVSVHLHWLCRKIREKQHLQYQNWVWMSLSLSLYSVSKLLNCFILKGHKTFLFGCSI